PPDSGVPARRFDNRSARLQPSLPFRRLNHAQANAVLHASTRIKRFQFNQHLGPPVFRDPMKAHNRRISDHLANVVVNRYTLHHEGPEKRLRIPNSLSLWERAW